jgi:PTS hybrid protein
MASVGIVVVSHSAKIAEGTVELARQMAPTTTLVAAGGTDEGGIGTSFDAVSAALGSADGGGGVVVLCDLGSAVLTSETAVDFLDDADRDRVVIVDAPIVEGAVAAAVAAETGGSLTQVAEAARSATGVADPHADERELRGGDAVEGSAVLVNASGLHARPAAPPGSSPTSRSTGWTRRACCASWASGSASARPWRSWRPGRTPGRPWTTSSS